MSEPKENSEVKNDSGNASEPASDAAAGAEERVEQQKEVSSPEVKTEPTAVEMQAGADEVSKLREQINNLNIALKKEREEKGQKVEELTKKLEETTAVYERLKQAFGVEQQQEETTPEYATKDELEAIVEQKLQQLKEEQEQSQKVEQYKKEIEELQKQWDGKDGKPKYDDEEVLEWQQKNNKFYLSPKEAFLQMKHQELLDWEVKQRLSQTKPAGNVEQPGSSPAEHKPETKDDFEENVKLNTRKAVLEAIEQAEQEM